MGDGRCGGGGTGGGHIDRPCVRGGGEEKEAEGQWLAHCNGRGFGARERFGGALGVMWVVSESFLERARWSSGLAQSR